MPRYLLWCTLVAVGAASGASGQPAPALPAAEARLKLASELDAYLFEHVLKPRFPKCIDREHGGFHTDYGRDWSPLEDRSRFIVYEARVTWTAATVARLRPETRTEYLPYVRHGVWYLADVMWDREHGGFHTLVDLSGRPLQEAMFGSRPVYGQAFAIYSLAAAHAATGDGEPLELARRGWRWIEDHYRDDLGPGYRSGVHSDGTPFPWPKDDAANRVDSIEGPALDRTMNDHIHLLEAYAELLRSWPDPELRKRTEELLAFVRDRIFVEPGCIYFALHPDGRAVPAPVSFGHDVETAFLMIEAEEALGRQPSAPTMRAARMLVDHALARGFDPARGQLFERGSAYGPPVDRSIEWWGQFEAWNAFFLMDEIYGKETGRYREAGLKAWALTRDAFTDRQHPGVCPRMDERGEVHCESKSHMWFASYHTARALLLTADRLRREAPLSTEPR
jgi:mannose/cellobiose epimerase-like protein (N-acyl-D-glucosamine 2-epimerase family)